MLEETLERYLFELKLEGDGLNDREIVKEVCAKFGVSKVTGYHDLKTKSTWQPLIQSLSRALLKAQNRHEQLYRKASFMYSQAKSDRARIAALNLMRQINMEQTELSGAKPTEQQTQNEPDQIMWVDPEDLKRQYTPSDTKPIPDNSAFTSTPQGFECSTVADAGAKPSVAPTNS